MNNIKDRVNELIYTFHTRDPFELCKCLNIPVLYEPLGNIKGFFQNTLNTPIIHLNSNLDEYEIKCVISHELGHSVLHKDLNVCFLKNYTFSATDKYENEANKFTAELLIDDNLLVEILEVNSLITCADLSKYFSVPTEFISYKFSNLYF